MASSLVIQQALFFQPVQAVSSIIPFDPKDNDFGDHDSKTIYNPWLVAKFGSAFFRRGNESYYTPICHSAKYFYKLPWSARNAAYVSIDAWDESTDFAVEFQHVTGSGMYVREPSDVEASDAEFRCDDFRYINAGTEAVLEKPS
ncbi:hypothetical protein VC83_01628 [Pseudogymnoascus destructans]|uniref:Uncharacterized protein n=1 Tax=Pseudogymnoascus destructans TaxID=655981 RepID=A0A177AIB9_9PEZI|nr:uncharacterized protein VC83_01628 [Pseudogymnoascus destructans]OAF61825.1 hypothetical protein VC83_01628 [Pseudogymnoascus destructans]